MFFCVPLFFFTSGYFYKPPKTLNELKIFYIKRLKGLYVPLVKWSALFLILHNFFYHINIYNSSYGYIVNDIVYTKHLYTLSEFGEHLFRIFFVVDSGEQLLGAFWFIRSLLLASLMVATLNFVFRRLKYINRFAILIFLIPITILSIHFNFRLLWVGSIGLLLLSTVFYVMGYCYRKTENEKFYNKITAFTVTFIMFLGVVYYKRVIEMLGIKDNDVLSFIILAFTGIIMILNISKWLEQCKIKNILYFIGNNTMIILALHFLCFKIVNLIKIEYYGWDIERLAEFPAIEENNSWWWIAYMLVGIAIPLFIQYLWNRAKVLVKTKFNFS